MTERADSSNLRRTAMPISGMHTPLSVLIVDSDVLIGPTVRRFFRTCATSRAMWALDQLMRNIASQPLRSLITPLPRASA